MDTFCKRCKKVGQETFVLLRETVGRCVPDVRTAAFKLVTGKFESSPFSLEELTALRKRWASLLADPADALVVDEGQPFLLRGRSQWLTVFEDPDAPTLVDIEDSFATGVPLGVDAPLPRTPQVYPEKVKHRKLDDSEFNPIAGSNSFQRNDDPLICTDEEKFCADKIRLGCRFCNLCFTLRFVGKLNNCENLSILNSKWEMLFCFHTNKKGSRFLVCVVLKF